ncbi:hypothetical protein ACFL96_18590 [Thermoproteota archaeon]
MEPQPAPEEPIEEVEEIESPAEPVIEDVEEEELIVEEAPDESGYDWESIPRSERREIESIRKAMDKAVSRDEDYFYRYTGPDQYQHEYWVKGDNLKIQVLEQDLLDKTTIKNVVILDRSDESAAWYCEHDNMNFCFSGKGPWPAVYSEFYRATPKEWLAELGQNFRYMFDDKISGVTYNIIDYTVDGKLIRAWIDSWNGYPLQIDFHSDLDPESEPTESYKFEDLDMSSVSESDVTP